MYFGGSYQHFGRTYKACSKSSSNLSINNIFLYVELILYYPLQNSPLCNNVPLLPPLPLLEALFPRCLWYCLQVICCISDEVFYCLKYTSFKGNFEFREFKKVRRGLVKRRGCEMVGIECFAKNCVIVSTVWVVALLWSHIKETVSHSSHFRSLSSYPIPQTSQNHQMKLFINCLTFRSEFLMHNASVIEIKNKQHCLHLLALLSCFLRTRWSRTLPVWGLLFGLSVTTVNLCLVTSNDILQKIFVIYSLKKNSSQESWPKFYQNPSAFLNLLLILCGMNELIFQPLLQLLGKSVDDFHGSFLSPG